MTARREGIAEIAEEMRVAAVRAETMLRKVYALHGPRVTGGKILRAAKFARMTKREVDAKYDFHDRHLMHAIARVIARASGDYP